MRIQILLALLIVFTICIAAVTQQSGAWQTQESSSNKGVDATKEGARELAKELLSSAAKEIGGKVLGNIDDAIFSPFESFMQSPSEESFSLAFDKLMEGGLKIAVPQSAVVIEGGRVIIGGSTFLLKDIWDTYERSEREKAIFGGMGLVSGLMGQDPFFESGAVQNRGITQENIGGLVKSERELEALWFTYYKRHLLGGPMGLGAGSRTEVEQGLKEGWPILRKYWEARRAAVLALTFRGAFERRARALAKGKSSAPADIEDIPEDEDDPGPDEDEDYTGEDDQALIDEAFPDDDDSGEDPQVQGSVLYVLDRVEVSPPTPPKGWTYDKNSNSAIIVVPPSYRQEYKWTPPPQQISSNAFIVSMTARVTPEPNGAGAALIYVNAPGFDSDNPSDKMGAYAVSKAGEPATAQQSVTFRARPSQSEVTVKFGMGWTVNFSYIYRPAR